MGRNGYVNITPTEDMDVEIITPQSPQQVLQDLEKRMEAAAELHGFDPPKTPEDHIEMNNQFIENTYKALGTARSGYEIVQIDLANGDFVNFYTPADNFYSSPTGSDEAYNMGRIPVEHLMYLYNRRVGAVYHACHRVAENALRNKFEFVDIDDEYKEIKRPIIRDVKRWIRNTKFRTAATEILEFERASGNGFPVFFWKNEKVGNLKDRPPSVGRPIRIESFSAQRMLPAGNYNFPQTLDYDKRRWKLRGGGVLYDQEINEDRVYVLETRRVEGNIRGLAIAEPVWIPLMCYMNTMYYILRALAQLEVVQTTFQSAKEYPTANELDAYITLGGKMRASKTFVVGAGGKAIIENMAGKIGSGIDTYLEFLREDMSAAWQIPKNQLFGRAEGGGIDGTGAVVSKEDYLSMLTGLQTNLTDDLMDILINIVGFKELEDVTLRWTIDLFKTEGQRLDEQLKRAQLELMMHQNDMAKIQKAQAALQLQVFSQNPQAMLPNNQNNETKPSTQPKKDFIEDFNLEDAIRKNQEYINNITINRAIQNRLNKLEGNQNGRKGGNTT